MADSYSKTLDPRMKDETGNVYGTLTVVAIAEARSAGGNAKWICRCECGNITTVCGASLRRGTTQSCGCTRYTQDGGHNTTEYVSLREMKSRCYNPNSPEYHHYGGRGIVVCEHWRASFRNFLADMGKKPSPKYSIERIDNNGNYSCGHCDECVANGWPMNCKWATRHEQARNRSNTRMLTHDGETMCLADWSRKLGLSEHAIRNRLAKGWSESDAVTIPAHGKPKTQKVRPCL